MVSNRLYILIVVLLLLSGCSTGNAPQATKANPTGDSLSAVQASPTTGVVAPTYTSVPSSTPTVPPTTAPTLKPTQAEPPQSTETSIPVTPACTNQATLVKHLSFSDKSTINSNSYFNKAWRIQNTGTCTWTTAYAFVFASGEQLNAPAETPLPHDVLPGETIDIQIRMKTPDAVNAYTGSWMLRDPNGVLFGTGETADQPISVNILVKKFTDTDKFPAPECG